MFKYIGKDNKIEEKKLADLTVTEFKEIIREVVAEEVAKHNFVGIPTVPVQPFYYQHHRAYKGNRHSQGARL